PTLIADWRERFAVGDFPFLIVSAAAWGPLQTKPVEQGWEGVRESQWRTARKVPNTGLAMTIDIGNADDVHPRNKQEVGRRLALVAGGVGGGGAARGAGQTPPHSPSRPTPRPRVQARGATEATFLPVPRENPYVSLLPAVAPRVAVPDRFRGGRRPPRTRAR